jgi:plasmid maintenance system killer protein
VITSFGNKVAQDIWECDQSKSLPRDLWIRAKALMTIMHSTTLIGDLKIKGQPQNIRLHKLSGARGNEWSITLKNDSPWRITFEFSNGEFGNVRIEDYH